MGKMHPILHMKEKKKKKKRMQWDPPLMLAGCATLTDCSRPVDWLVRWPTSASDAETAATQGALSSDAVHSSRFLWLLQGETI